MQDAALLSRGESGSRELDGASPAGPAADEPEEGIGPSGAGGPHGRVVFATADQRDTACTRLAQGGAVVAQLEGIGPSTRGRLGEAIDEAIERELAARGTSGPGLTSSADRDAALSDQLFRARRAGARGIAVILGPLRAATGPLRALAPEDGLTLRFLANATRERPLLLVLDANDANTGAYGDPVALRDLLVPPSPARASSPSPSPAPSPSAPTPTPAPTPVTDLPEPSPPPPAPPPPERHTAGATVAARDDAWRTWTLQLAAARGPQPLAALERLFAEAYMPLTNAIASGLDDPRARHARDEFATTFSKSFVEASATFAATTKRPRMVLDAHDTAARIARLHGARTMRLLLVDAMRWDLSRVVEERLVARLGPRASLTDELLLWSALPTTTMRQLETIARGVEALRTPATLDPENELPRGRTAEYVRRMRIGPREVHKLDLVEARLQAARGQALRELPDIADAVADAIARHAETLAPRTLLFVFGDHGFTFDKSGGARQGGASPEEVLVGAFAVLVGDVH